MKHILIASAYGAFAVAFGLVSPDLVPGIAPPVNWIAAAMVFLAGALAHEAHARTDNRALVSGQVQALRMENATLREQVDHLREAMDDISANLGAAADGGAAKAQEEIDRVVAEVRVLQTLIEQLSKAAPKPAAADKAEAGAAKPRAPRPSGTGTAGDGVAAPGADGASGVEGLDEDQVLDIVRDGLRKERVDLYLQPIVSLPQRRTRFYECFSRIRTEDGVVISPDQYMEVAKREGLIGAIDNMLLFRCVQLVRKVQSRNQKEAFFCNISANTLKDGAFFDDFVGFMAANKGLANNLIFEFSQTDLDTHRREIGEYATRLGQLGFSFSLDHIEDLAKLDFKVLAALGFRFLKVDVERLLEVPMMAESERAPDAAMAGAEAGDGAGVDTVVGVDIAMLKRTLDLHGIDLVVEKIEQEDDLLELLDYRIDFGQGFLFGEPRLSRSA
ncbi:MAG: EAL domain-containing protein [Alphaproteobacteria bacterium]|nr:EAL domain-containing protein [Alphaproteobacteria bacterium]